MTRLLRATVGKLLSSVALLLAISFVVFVLLHLAPGSPGAAVLGTSATPQEIARFNRGLGLDQGLLNQYWSWLVGVLQGNFGVSWSSGLPVDHNLVSFSGVTLSLAGGGLLAGTAGGVAIGVAQGLRPDSRADHLAGASTSAVLAMPQVWLAMLLSVVFGVLWKILPVSGYVPPNQDAGQWVRDLVLPWLAVGAPVAALVARQCRVSFIKVMESDYIRAALAIGASMPRVVLRHALRPTMVPVTAVIGFQAAIAIGTAVIVESVFALPGLGSWMTIAAQARDAPVLLAGVLVTATAVVLARLVADLVQAALDPAASRP